MTQQWGCAHFNAPTGCCLLKRMPTTLGSLLCVLFYNVYIDEHSLLTRAGCALSPRLAGTATGTMSITLIRVCRGARCLRGSLSPWPHPHRRCSSDTPKLQSERRRTYGIANTTLRARSGARDTMSVHACKRLGHLCRGGQLPHGTVRVGTESQ